MRDERDATHSVSLITSQPPESESEAPISSTTEFLTESQDQKQRSSNLKRMLGGLANQFPSVKKFLSIGLKKQLKKLLRQFMKSLLMKLMKFLNYIFAVIYKIYKKTVNHDYHNLTKII